MDKLPEKDTAMLVSAINFLLRDELFDNLDQICFHYDMERSSLEKRLEKEGYHYDEEQKRIW